MLTNISRLVKILTRWPVIIFGVSPRLIKVNEVLVTSPVISVCRADGATSIGWSRADSTVVVQSSHLCCINCFGLLVQFHDLHFRIFILGTEKR